jgi:putative toxin-antitoxin system antitoxin component (TIGR02293 family)
MSKYSKRVQLAAAARQALAAASGSRGKPDGAPSAEVNSEVREHPRRGPKPGVDALEPQSAPALEQAAATTTSPDIAEILSRRQPLSTLYATDTLERVEQVRRGVPAALIQVLSEDMRLPKEKLYAALGLPRATISRKLQAKQTLSPDESERVLGVARLVGQVDAMVRGSGEAKDFDAAQWLAQWLEQPNPALGRKRPAEFLDTADGRSLISDLLSRMNSGAYS